MVKLDMNSAATQQGRVEIKEAMIRRECQCENGNCECHSNKGKVHCPAHNDANPSLSVKAQDGKILYHCFAQCSQNAVTNALQKRVGPRKVTNRNMPPISAANRLGPNWENAEHIFDYPDESGKTLFQVARRGSGPGKKFAQRRPHPERPGVYIYGLSAGWYECKNGHFLWVKNQNYPPQHAERFDEVRRVPLNLPDVLNAKIVVMHEGELCAEEFNNDARKTGVYGDYVGTTAPQGASSAGKCDLRSMQGKVVVIVPDDNPAGERYRNDVHAAVSDFASVCVVELPDRNGGDYVDFCAAGHTFEEAHVLIDAAKEWTKSTKKFQFTTDDVLDKCLSSIKWLWPGYIPRGFVTLIVGDQDQGKSTVAQDFCRTIFIGGCWPNGEPCNIEAPYLLWIDTEGSLALFRQRLHDWNMPRGRFILPTDPIKELAIDNAADWRWIEEAIEELNPPLVVVGSLSGGHSGEENSNDAMKAVLKRLSALAQRRQIAVVVIHHLAKVPSGAPEYPINLNRIRGASSISQFCRSILALSTPDREAPEQRRLDVIKLNISRKPEALGYVLTDDGPAWGKAPEPRSHRRVADDAVEFLRDALANGVRESDAVLTESREANIGMTAFKAAKKILNVRSRREGGKDGRWFLNLPPNGTDLSEDTG